jgi:hypothetical protein
MKKNISILIYFLLIASMSYAQKNYYFLPKAVVDSINIHLNTADYEGEVFVLLGFYNNYNYVTISSSDSSKQDLIYPLLKATNRFVKLNDQDIPLIMSFDISYSSFFFEEYKRKILERSVNIPLKKQIRAKTCAEF